MGLTGKGSMTAVSAAHLSCHLSCQHMTFVAMLIQSILSPPASSQRPSTAHLQLCSVLTGALFHVPGLAGSPLASLFEVHIFFFF